jgi:hypothetical protein
VFAAADVNDVPTVQYMNVVGSKGIGAIAHPIIVVATTKALTYKIVGLT